MKKIIASIIISISLFTSAFVANANNDIINGLFDLNTWVEEYKLNLSTLEQSSFSNPAVQQTYDKFIETDAQLRELFLSQYRAWEISYYEMQDLINSYNSFVYYTGRTFSYISLQEKGQRGKEIEKAIANGYTQMRNNYAKVKHILRK